MNDNDNRYVFTKPNPNPNHTSYILTVSSPMYL